MPTLLFVDDDAAIRQTLPSIMQMRGFDTTIVATVAGALAQITSKQFDVLLTDLNIGEPGDGFTVVSAMRRSQPHCRCFILTGFPAFEAALKAIHSQVDDFFVKPANPPVLLESIEKSLKEPQQERRRSECKRLSTVLRERSQEILNRALMNMKADSQLSSLPLSDDERMDRFPALIHELADMLDSDHPELTPPETMKAAESRGRMRLEQDYSVELLVRGMRMVLRAVHDVVQESLLEVDLSKLMLDMKWLEDSVAMQLEMTVSSYLRAAREKALRSFE